MFIPSKGLATRLVAILLLTPTAARAIATGCDAAFSAEYTGGSDRVRVEVIGGRRVLVLVPTDYDSSSRSYPAAYLMHGGLNNPDWYLTGTDLVEFTAGQPADRQAIVVIPDGTIAPAWHDWRNGALHDETLFLEAILPTIDSEYRTIRDGRHRAVAGFSGGGLGAMHLAGHHPDLFAAAGSFSGLVDVAPDTPIGVAGSTQVYAAGAAYAYCYDQPAHADPFGVAGDPLVEPVWIRDLNPTSLAPNYGGLSVSIFVGNGVPCDAADALTLVSYAPFAELELGLRAEAEGFDEALRRASVAHSITEYDCGIHTYRYVERSIHDWWEPMFRAFGTPAPTAFDHRRAAPNFAVWGWTFTADPRRAPEFLDVADASCAGLGLTGSGTTTVTTASCFPPGETVALTGAVEPDAAADEGGRITFQVDLGPAHQFQQYTPPARALEATGGYLVSRAIFFRPR
jgi:S-formylglutathione hydrolase FrmB